MSGQFATNTTVSIDASRAEIERTLMRYGADSFAYGWSSGSALIAFSVQGRGIRMTVSMPDRNDREFTHHSRGSRTAAAAFTAWEQACKQRWRALHLVIKAKLEAIASGIATFEDEFLAYVVLPNGHTVAEEVRPSIIKAFETGTTPALMPGLS